MYQVLALKPQPFQAYLGATDDQLNALGVRCERAHSKPGFPCRVSLDYADVGERVFLFNYAHHRVATPYESKFAIYVRESALAPKADFAEAYVNELPPVFHVPTDLSVRAYDAKGWLMKAALVKAPEAGDLFNHLLDLEEVDYLHAHYAAYGCYAALVKRA